MMTPEYTSLPARRVLEPASTQQPTVAVWLAMFILWVVAGVGILSGLAFLVGIVIVPVLGAATPFVVMILLILLAAMLSALRRRRRNAVLAYIEQAMRLNLPLPAMLRAAERSEGKLTARALRHVRVELEGGQTIQDAIAHAIPGTSLRTLGLIGSAERTGGLPRALRRLSQDAVRRFNGGPGNELYLRWYPLMLALFTGALVSAFCVFVMPKFEDIFRDFRVALPASTRFVVDTWRVAAIPLSILLGVILLAYVARLLSAIFAPESHSRGPLRWVIDRIAWYVPGAAGPTRWRSLGDACNVLADALESGHALDWSLTEASRSGTNDVLAEQLAIWADHARAGHPAAEAARRAEMPPLLVGLLRTSGGAELPDVFRFLARYYDSRFARATVILQAILTPAVALIAGAIVGSIVFALFVPLVRLVDSVNGNVWKM